MKKILFGVVLIGLFSGCTGIYTGGEWSRSKGPDCRRTGNWSDEASGKRG